MCCTDPLISCLKAFGYSIVRMPTSDLEPLQLMLRSGRALERLGGLDAVLLTGRHARVPRITRNRPAAAVTGRRTGQLDAGVGLTLLGSVLAAMGGSTVGVEAAYRSARSVTFEFQDVSEDAIAVVDLDQYLADARVNPRAHHVATLLDRDDLYVTTAVVKSPAITVRAQDDTGIDLSVTVPALQQLIGGRVTISPADARTSALTYAGVVPLAFGFRAVRLFYDHGRYGAFKPLAAGEAALGRGDAAPEWLVDERPFVTLENRRDEAQKQL
ncbi:MAG TPA: hypothetical protein VGK32_21580 [Vicinamibacterales bacterium]|jgi:hypothetical protein